MNWLWLALGIVLGLTLLAALGFMLFHLDLRRRHLSFVVRVFQEKPLFIIPRGAPATDAEDVRFPTSDGLTLSGCYLRTENPHRLGVILFGLEFGSNRWACVPYCEYLLKNGFDVFAFESRSQGESDPHPGYEPLQWVTDFEVRDVQAALAYLKGRPDADPRGVGFFGISKGGSAGLLAAGKDSFVRCFVTDGVFATRTTMIPYMQKWVAIVSTRQWLQRVLPRWYYGLFASTTLHQIQRDHGCHFPHLEPVLPRLGRRPLLMIHGGADNYIKPEMARTLFAMAKQPKELWIVEGAKHNQALQIAGEEYRQRVLAFFRSYLAEIPASERKLPAAAPKAPASLPKAPAARYRVDNREPVVERR